MTNSPQDMSGVPSTPVTEQGVRTFFEGLVAIQDTLVYSAPARVALAISPSLAALLEQFCGNDPRYRGVMAEVWINDYKAIKDNGQ